MTSEMTGLTKYLTKYISGPKGNFSVGSIFRKRPTKHIYKSHIKTGMSKNDL